MDAHATGFTSPLHARRSRQRSCGHTLQELLITVGLVSALLATAYPTLKPPGEYSESRRFTMAITGALSTARSTAIATGGRVTFCGSLDGSSCERDWPADIHLLVFTDSDDNHAMSTGDTLHLQRPLELKHGRGLGRLSAGRPYLRYRGDGSAVEFGRFTYCPADGSDDTFRQLVINRVGRVYQHHDDSGQKDHCD